ncbi:MAG: lipid-A-disaccharide synthase [Candidatus Omnitrophica bacterium]|nr:lipid-A-disaccharide synthase [Candidatus Omnitrophota bacterium]
MEKIKHIFISCGEPSGDLFAANLITAIKSIIPDIKFSGLGGNLVRQVGGVTFYDIKELSVIGFFDSLKRLPVFLRLRKLILKKIGEEKPDAIIFVDFSGFNLRLAKAINKKIPTIYYVSPQVWASRQGRVKIIKKYIDKMLVFFKFEEEFYRKFSIPAEFIGHPLLDIVKPSMEKPEFFAKFKLSESKTTITLLPGSRHKEIENILPVMLSSSLILLKELKDVQVIIAKSTHVDLDAYNRLLKNTVDLDIKIIEGQTYDCLNAADFCLVASGTATLETAIMQKPFLIVYKMSPLNYHLYKPQVKIPYIGMFNIVANKKIIPEFIQDEATGRNIADEAIKILTSPQRLQDMKDSLKLIKPLLGESGASLRAAQIIVDFLQTPQP